MALANYLLIDSTLYPVDQVGMRFYNRVATDREYSGMIVDQAEADRLCEVLSDKNILMMGNHGVTVVAPTVALAFDELYHLERACETLVTAYTTGKELKVVSRKQPTGHLRIGKISPTVQIYILGNYAKC